MIIRLKILFAINMKNKSHIADYMIVASGTSSRHLQALSEILVTELKKLAWMAVVLKVGKAMIGN